jgi:peptidoglycan/LPS O-acetylase OafA/YrhL
VIVIVLAGTLEHDPKVLPLGYLAQFAAAFFSGGLIAASERQGIPAVVTCMGCAAIGIIAAASDQRIIAYAMIVVAISVLVGRLRSPTWLIPKVDLSYGVYIYSFPVQQVVIGYPLADFWSGYFIALAVTVLLATASHFLIEAPALRLKRRFAYPSPRLSAAPNALRHEEPSA